MSLCRFLSCSIGDLYFPFVVVFLFFFGIHAQVVRHGANMYSQDLWYCIIIILTFVALCMITYLVYCSVMSRCKIIILSSKVPFRQILVEF